MSARFALIVLLWLAGTLPGLAQNCSVSHELVSNFSPLQHVHEDVSKNRKLNVVVLSAAPSQVGAAAGLKSYPSFLEAALRERLKNTEVSVFAFSVPRKPIDDIVAALPGLLKERKPDLVVWQTGTVEAIRQMDPDVYGEKLMNGVEMILAAKADVILINQQYSPRTDYMFDGAPYTDNMRWVAQNKDISLFNRYEIMKYWAETGIFDLSGMRNDGLYEKLHRCLGGLLSDFIVRAASLPGSLEQ
jgi:hypothetical protein